MNGDMMPWMTGSPIEKEITGYLARIEGTPGTDPNKAYGGAFLAEIYEPRVQELRDLQSQGFTLARWESGHWHGVHITKPEPNADRFLRDHFVIIPVTMPTKRGER